MWKKLKLKTWQSQEERQRNDSVSPNSAREPQLNMRENKNRLSFVLYARFPSYRRTPVSIPIWLALEAVPRPITEPGFRLPPE